MQHTTNIPKEATSSTVCALIELDQVDPVVEGGSQEEDYKYVNFLHSEILLCV